MLIHHLSDRCSHCPIRHKFQEPLDIPYCHYHYNLQYCRSRHYHCLSHYPCRHNPHQFHCSEFLMLQGISDHSCHHNRYCQQHDSLAPGMHLLLLLRHLQNRLHRDLDNNLKKWRPHQRNHHSHCQYCHRCLGRWDIHLHQNHHNRHQQERILSAGHMIFEILKDFRNRHYQDPHTR